MIKTFIFSRSPLGFGVRPIVFAAALGFGLGPAHADTVLFADNFDAGTSGANWTTNKSANDSVVDFAFDYNTIGIPAAPRSTGATTIGTRFLVNQSAGVQQGISASPNGQSFTGNFKIRFDLWSNYVGQVSTQAVPGTGIGTGGISTAPGNGTTQVSHFGWGTSGTTPQWGTASISSTVGSSHSVMFGATGDAGSNLDYLAFRASNVSLSPASTPRVYPAGIEGSGLGADSRNASNAYYTAYGNKTAPAAQVALYPDQKGTTPNGASAFAWRDVVIEKTGNIVTWNLDEKLIATVDITGTTLGGTNLFLGMFDINAGSSNAPNDFLITSIYDNLVVTSNAVPVFVGAPYNFTFSQGQSIQGASVVATDADDTTLTYTLSGGALPEGVTFNSDGSFSGTPTTSSAPLTRTVTVSDGKGGTATAQVTLSVVASGGAIISEFRFRGKGGALDEYVELYNKRGFALNISGWSIQTRTATGLQTTLVPDGKIIPPFGRYLFTGAGFSLTGYGTSDQTIAADIFDASGVALFNAAGAVQDAVGFTTSDAALREGAGLPSAPTSDGEYAFVRDFTGTLPKDTADSTQDFVFVIADADATTTAALATVTGTGGNVVGRLGAPSPEGIADPAYANPIIAGALLDPSVSQSAAPNRERVGFVPGTSLGDLLIRRTITNNSGRAITKLRFSVASITSLGTPGPSGQADVRLVSSGDENVTIGGASVPVKGLTVETGATGQPALPLGGGLGSSAVLGEVSMGTPLADGASRSVVFRLRILKSGAFSVLFNFHAAPGS